MLALANELNISYLENISHMLMKNYSRIILRSISFLVIYLCLVKMAWAQLPFADIHIHYNWDHAELTTTEDVIEKLKSTNTQFAVVSSTPTHLALELREKAGEWIIPIFSPYTHELGKRDWYLDKSVISKAKKGLASKAYYGIGEIHFMAGLPPKISNPNFLALMELASQYKVPALIHVDSGDEQFLLNVCRTHSNVKILFAHAGGNLSPLHIRKILEGCSNVWIEFSARDPWRYGGLTDDKHQLLNEWRLLVLEFPRRFLTGTDPVWRVTRTQSWDQADDGWDHYQQLFDYHQHWINALPEKIQNYVRWQNALELFSTK